VWVDIVLGFLIAGALAAWVPETVWQRLFLAGHPALARIEGPLVGPLVAIISFVCSVGNVPLAAVLWRGGISFGGVVSFIFADLIILPILDIYRRYYGRRVALYILATFYVTMAAAGYVVELVFSGLGIIPANRTVGVITQGPTWNYTSFAQYCVSGHRNGSLDSLPADWRTGHAAHDGVARGPDEVPRRYRCCCIAGVRSMISGVTM